MFATISRPSQVINFTTTPRPYFSPFYLTYLKISLYFFTGLRIRPPSPRLWFYNMEFMQRCGQFLLFTAICIIIIELNDSYVTIYSKYKFVLTYILGIRRQNNQFDRNIYTLAFTTTSRPCRHKIFSRPFFSYLVVSTTT